MGILRDFKLLMGFIILWTVFFNSPTFGKSQPFSAPPPSSANCGPIVLQYYLEKTTGKVLSLEDLINASDTIKGQTNFYGMENALRHYGVEVSAYKGDLDTLKMLVEETPTIVHYYENHYAVVESIEEKWIFLYDPGSVRKNKKVPLHAFEDVWDGSILACLSKSDKFLELDLTLLIQNEKTKIVGGANCQNPTGCGGCGSGPSSNDPVNLGNGNMHMKFLDFDIPTQGLPVKIVRTYNAQVISDIEGITPQEDTSSWHVDSGVYSGSGDRSETSETWEDIYLEIDFQTIVPGTESYHVAWINFRYVDEQNRYYILLNKNGTLELTRFKGGNQSFLQQVSTTANPLELNTLKIQARGKKIEVWLNGNKEISLFDIDALTKAGKVVMESFYCHAHYDNLLIKDLSTLAESFWDFSEDDNDGHFGLGWRMNFERSLIQKANGDIIVRLGNDKRYYYHKQDDGSYTVGTSADCQAPPGIYDILTETTNGFELREKYGTVYYFNTSGELTKITDRNLNETTLSYKTVSGKRRIDYVTGGGGRSLHFDYDTSSHVSEITGPIGRTTQYTYDSNERLSEVYDKRGNVRTYTYYPTGPMTSFVDRNGNTFHFTYYYNDRVNQQTGPDGEIIDFEYLWSNTIVTQCH